MNTLRAPSRSRRQRGGPSAAVLLAFCLLLAAPAYALSRLSAHLDWRVLVGVPLGLSLVAFLAYRSDKRRAEAGQWRIPETTLHVLALLGGWPGAFLAQRTFRHKTSKVSFQFMFWIIVLLHQFAALDSLLGWQLTKGAFRALKIQMT